MKDLSLQSLRIEQSAKESLVLSQMTRARRRQRMLLISQPRSKRVAHHAEDDRKLRARMRRKKFRPLQLRSPRVIRESRALKKQMKRLKQKLLSQWRWKIRELRLSLSLKLAIKGERRVSLSRSTNSSNAKMPLNLVHLRQKLLLAKSFLRSVGKIVDESR